MNYTECLEKFGAHVKKNLRVLSYYRFKKVECSFYQVTLTGLFTTQWGQDEFKLSQGRLSIVDYISWKEYLCNR